MLNLNYDIMCRFDSDDGELYDMYCKPETNQLKLLPIDEEIGGFWDDGYLHCPSKFDIVGLSGLSGTCVRPWLSPSSKTL